jgi:uncharacterized protein YwgA
MLKKKERVLSKIFRMLNFSSVEPNSFENRLVYQKIIYLLQYSGVNLGYRFNWYIRGPYSPELTNVIFKIQEEPSVYSESQNIRFKNQEEIDKKITKFLKTLGENAKNPEFLEILASISYIKENDAAYANSDERLKNRLISLKPFVKDFSNFDQLYENSLKSLQTMSGKNA